MLVKESVIRRIRKMKTLEQQDIERRAKEFDEILRRIHPLYKPKEN